jgi:chromosomal replication initiator protein
MLILKWEKCINYFKKNLSISEFSMWIKPLQPKIIKNKLILYVPNNFFLYYIKEKYFKKIKILIKKHINVKPIFIKLIVNKKIIKTSKKFKKKKKELNKNNINPLKNYKFKNFVIGKSNKLAYKSAYQVAKNPGNFYNPFLLYGKTGLGKTHLMHSIKNFIKKKNDNIIYSKSENFVQKMVESLKNNSIDKFKKYYRSANILIMEDIQFFSNKKRTQEEFLYTINSLIEKNKQIIITSNCHPKKIKGIQKRLKSRLNWGLNICIKKPEKKTRIKILIKKSYEKKIFLPYKIIYFLAKNLKSNTYELEGALNRIKANILFNKNKSLTLNLVKNILKDLVQTKKKKIYIKKIQKTVSKHYNIKLSELLSKKKYKSIILPRQIAMSLSKKLTNHSLQEIGNFFNKKSHTTVLYSCKKIKKLIQENNIIKKNYFSIIKKIFL